MKITITKIRTVRFQVRCQTDSKDRCYELAFVPTDGAPGYTHRVLLDGTATKMWLSDTHKPDANAARYFAEKLLSNQE